MYHYGSQGVCRVPEAHGKVKCTRHLNIGRKATLPCALSRTLGKDFAVCQSNTRQTIFQKKHQQPLQRQCRPPQPRRRPPSPPPRRPARRGGTAARGRAPAASRGRPSRPWPCRRRPRAPPPAAIRGRAAVRGPHHAGRHSGWRRRRRYWVLPLASTRGYTAAEASQRWQPLLSAEMEGGRERE